MEAHTLTDQRGDTAGVRLHQLVLTYGEPPDFVKQAHRDELLGGDLPAHLFADPDGKLPLHSAAACWLSALHLAGQEEHLPEKRAAALWQALENAADVHGVLGHVGRLRDKAAALRVVPAEDGLPDDDFAVVLVPHGAGSDPGPGAGLSPERHWPLRNADEVAKAADLLAKHAQEFTFPERRAAARRVLTKAAHFQVTLDAATGETLRKAAGLGLASAVKVARALGQRAEALFRTRQSSAVAEKLLKLAQRLRDHPGQCHKGENLVKLADALDRVDRYFGLGHLPPVDDLFAVSAEKLAAARENYVRLGNGVVFTKQALACLRVEPVRALLGSAVADACTSNDLFLDAEKCAQVLPGLNRPDCETFERLAAQAGAVPVYYGRNTQAQRLSWQDLATAAAPA